jgi:DNA-binding NtrC family response regulator
MYVLVISRDRNYRRLYVDNLVIRGYPAVGIANVEEGTRLLRNQPPFLIVVCQASEMEEDGISLIRDIPQLASTPIVLSNTHPPDYEWMAKWGIEDFILFGEEDVQHLVKRLAPWLPSSDQLSKKNRRKEEQIESGKVTASESLDG